MLITVMLGLSVVVGAFLYYRYGALGWVPTVILLLILAALYLTGGLALH